MAYSIQGFKGCYSNTLMKLPLPKLRILFIILFQLLQIAEVYK